MPSEAIPFFRLTATTVFLSSTTMPDLPRLTDRKIKSLVGERSFTLGQDYLADGALTHLRRAGRLLTACVQGTAAKPYKVSLRFDAHGALAAADCACPVGSGACKHVAAVLLAFMRTPDAFVPADSLDAKLNKLDKPHLVALLKQIFRRDPDLETLLDTLPHGKKPLAPEPFAAQADHAFDNAPDDWGYTGEIAARLRAIVESADDFLAAAQPANAAAAYRGILQSVLAHEYVLNDDEPGHLFPIVQDCCTGLGKCLASITTPAGAREPILHALFNVTLFDLESGGTGLSDDAVAILYDQTTPQDRRAIVPWIRTALKHPGGYARDYAREALTDMLEEFDRTAP